MLRLDVKSPSPRTSAGKKWRVSLGSAGVIGLQDVRMDAAPTTAYLMLGTRCARACSFCTQARDSDARVDALSRVSWPEHDADEVVAAIAAAYTRGRLAHEQGHLARACFQVTVSEDYVDSTLRAVSALARACDVPICASIAPRNLDDVAALLDAGAERVTIALDAACERVYAMTKGGSWERTVDLLRSSATRFPGHIGTHLIVGLGETEREMVTAMRWLHALDIRIGLFAFTPVSGTAMADRQAPPRKSYRRIQVARWLLVEKAIEPPFRFDEAGRLIDFGIADERLRASLVMGEALRTSGCPGCNRPYYNERPGSVPFNYPRALTDDEAHAEIEELLAGLDSLRSAAENT